MSWQNAKEEARRWTDRLQLPRAMKNQAFDLSAASRGKIPLRFEGVYRLMILRAAKRVLAAREINGFLDDVDTAGEAELPQE